MTALLLDFRIAVMNLIEHSKRTAFLGGAIAVVTAMFVFLGALSNGLSSTLIDSATTLVSGHLNVGGFYKVTAGQAAPLVSDFPKALQIVKESMPELDYAVVRGRGWGKLVSDQGSMQAGLGGIDIAKEPNFRSALKITSGNIEDLAQPNAILLFEGQAKRLSLRVGDALTISAQTTRGVANTVDCQVVAIARDIGLLSTWNVFVSNAALRTLYQLNDRTAGVIQLHLKPRYVDDLSTIAARLRKTLEEKGYAMMEPDPRAFFFKFQTVSREGWTGQKLDVTTWQDELSFMMWTMNALQGLSGLLLLILLAIVVTGIMNTLWIAIRERTREIGTLRAIGMHRGGILRMFLFETTLLGLCGAAAGVALGSGVCLLINAAQIHVPISVQLFLMRDTVHLALLPGALLSSVITITVITAAAAFYPSLRATRLKPVDAMAHFG
ncbi:MAG TPA: FtsX-like permease family protein [Polyangiales bacterium]|nr:FtsX-like permease family protein [Polyangiales bacterium]